MKPKLVFPLRMGGRARHGFLAHSITMRSALSFVHPPKMGPNEHSGWQLDRSTCCYELFDS